MQNIVARTFDVDFIYLDIIFFILWVLILIRYREVRALIAGAFGIAVNFVIDDLIWYHLQGTRIVEGPIHPDVFLAYFSVTYGMIQYSYVVLMFEKRMRKQQVFWTSLLFGGWTFIGAVSFYLPIDDRVMQVSRNMSGGREIEISMIVLGYFLLFILAKRWKKMKDFHRAEAVYIFCVGILVHLSMELSLLLAGIRPINLQVFLFNSILEWNSGIPIMYMLWILSRESILNENTAFTFKKASKI